MDSLVERKQLLAKRRAVKKKIESSVNTNELKLFDFIYFNPKDNPMPTRERKIFESPKSQDKLIPNKPTENSSTEATNSSGNDNIQEINIEAAHESVTDERDFSDILDERQEEERVDNLNLEPKCANGSDDSDDCSMNGNTDCISAPQLKIGANGQLILDEQSLSIKTTAAKDNENLQIETVEETDDSYSYGKYNKKRKRSTDWTFKETARFYKALSTVGTDFLLMQSLFQWRSREELKLKFKKEERSHKELIDKVLADSTQFDFSIFDESDYDPEEDRKTSKKEDAKRRKEQLKEKRKKLIQDKTNERKLLKKQNNDRKQFLRSTFSHSRKSLRRNSVQMIDEDSNDSRATSIMIDAEEIVFEMTLLDKDPDEAQMDSGEVNDQPAEMEESYLTPEVAITPEVAESPAELIVGDPAKSLAIQETWFDVADIQTDELGKTFVELKVDDVIKNIPVPSVQKDTSRVVVVATKSESGPLYHVYLASCSNEAANVTKDAPT